VRSIEQGLVGAEIAASEERLTRLALIGNRAQDILELVGADAAVGNHEDMASELAAFAALEECVPTPDWAPILSPSAYGALLGEISVYHSSLPVTDAERTWLYETFTDVSHEHGTASSDANLLEAISRQRVSLVTLGREQIVMGEELISRWSEWRNRCSSGERELSDHEVGL
jgi:hypothetical protein